MDFLKETKKKAKDAKLSVQELAIADMVAVGWNVRDAILITAPEGRTWGDVYFRKKAAEISNNVAIQTRIKEVQIDLKKQANERMQEERDVTMGDVSNFASKENLLRDLNMAKNSVVPNSKEWLDIVKTIADISQAKKDEVKEEDTTIHYYLPLKCNNCELYINKCKK